ncbi:glycoside hydrolase family 16 protein [Namhaeicola litoreus]|uniref:Family 16 glycosylhydrolase n=1 Tax=Namhaeicola litoreus TaxID=1052145 RepID=A0ABW3Y7I3_9FLAO
MNLIDRFKTRAKLTFFSLSIFIAATILISSCSNDETQNVVNFKELVMQDEFDIDGPIDTSLWSYDIGNGEGTAAGKGWGNNELQYYTDRSENITVQNGVLIISAKKEDYEGSSYTSARILTKGKFEQAYGRFEARIRLPYGQGLWPAFWLLGNNIDEVEWPNCGEIDIMENRGQEPTITNGTVHGPGYSGGMAITKAYDLVNARLDTNFHVYGIEWGPEYINFYVDDVLYNQIRPEDVTGDWVFDRPFYIILNLAVGGSFVGSPNSETSFPQTMLVDYVRVYKK